MSKKKTAGAIYQQTNRKGKRLGVKLFGGQKAKAGNIIIRQRGTKYHPGEGVKKGKDHTLYAIEEGIVTFKMRQAKMTVSVK